VDTGTIAPGMSEKEVYSLWGPPIAVRHQGAWTYLFFRNGCEYTCGTEDVVTLQNGQVVDAVLRWKFKPGLTNKVPVEVWVEIPITFRLGE